MITHRHSVHGAAHPEKWTKCRLIREKGDLNYRGELFKLLLEEFDGKKDFLLAAKKRKCFDSVIFDISSSPSQIERTGNSFLGKLKGNRMGTHFRLILADDSSVEPTEKKMLSHEIMTVNHDINVLGAKGPKRVQITLTEQHEHKENDEDAEQIVMHSRQPTKDLFRNFVLEFGGRAVQSSKKNLQIVQNDGEVVLQFARVSENIFSLDFRGPLNSLQAFAVALSCFHATLVTE